mmetsp:Transcript_39014/g.82038  ORF Transcript_39014/g.82038 Transcript_39014/m.82038 type:complete len:90 (+) Transcript_39014:511-780(+)
MPRRAANAPTTTNVIRKALADGIAWHVMGWNTGTRVAMIERPFAESKKPKTQRLNHMYHVSPTTESSLSTSFPVMWMKMRFARGKGMFY